MVNRIWQLHFGQGIVRTLSNFGQLGERPTHPELLDYLAARFVESGWSIKAMHREIMLSATYALSTDHAGRTSHKDPDNRLLWRANLRPRLDAEAIRDSLLAVAGTLDETVVARRTSRERKPTAHRVRLHWPDHPGSMLALFDFPNPNNTSEKRPVTSGPLQRLFFMNNSFVLAQAKTLAERLQREAGASDAHRIERAYLLLFSRPPTESEKQAGLEFLRTGSQSWPQYAQVLLSSSEFSAMN